MVKIQVGSITTSFGPNGEIINVTKKPSYLIKDNCEKIELTEEQEKEYGIGEIAD